jgi:tetratricopeptide (TPR) repeat protein
VHWPFARVLLDAMQPRPFRDDYVRLWYRTTSAFFLAWNDYAQGAPHLEHARRLLTDDAVLMTHEGALHEAYAEPRVQHAVGIFRSPTPQAARDLPNAPDRFSGTVSQAANEWRLAEGLFRAAVKLDPASSEARIRLGHVLSRRGRDQDAVAELERALADEPSALLSYYARLFLGRAQQSLGRDDEARRSFEEAQRLYPQAQSPAMGLSAIARRAGDRVAAREVLMAVALSTPASDVRDPYWTYNRAHEPDLNRLLQALRAESVGLRRSLSPGQPGPGGSR